MAVLLRVASALWPNPFGWRSGGGPVRPLAESQAIALVFGTHDRHQSVLSVWGHNGRLWFQSLPFIGGARLHNPVP